MLSNGNRNLAIATTIIYALVQMVMTGAVLALLLDAQNARKQAVRDRQEQLSVANENNKVQKKIEKQNVYKVCMIDAIWDTEPQDRNQITKENCRLKAYGE
jgi:hypothetical protein